MEWPLEIKSPYSTYLFAIARTTDAPKEAVEHLKSTEQQF